MANKYVTAQQYEPLRTPSNWTAEERNFSRQITDRFDELYSRFNRLRFEDLNKVMQSRIETIEGYSTDIQQNANQIALKANQQTVDALTGRVTDAETSLTLKANAATLQSVADDLQSQLNVVPGQITTAVSKASYASSLLNSTTGQQLVLSLSRGTILDKNNTATIATARIFENGADITDTVPASIFRWERISDDTAGDTTWNAVSSHIGAKSITIAAADVSFRCVIRCIVDAVSALAAAAVSGDDLTIIDGQDDTGSDFSINANGELIYNGDSQYSIVDGYLTAQTATTRFTAELTYSNLKTSFISIYPEGIDIFSNGKINMEAGSEMSLKAGNIFNLRAGTGTSSIGISNNEANSYMQWAGAADPAAAPYSVKQDGSVKMTKLTLGNSAITDLTQMYAQTFSDNADATHAAVIKLFVPSEATGVQSLKLSFELQAYRAFSTTTETIASVEKTSTSGGGTTVSSGSGGILQTQNTSLTTTTPSTSNTGSSSATYTGDSMGDGYHNHSMGHNHSLSAHTHDINGHNHTLSDHTHNVTISGHTHKVTVDGHNHAITYGIYEGTTATSCTVAVDGNAVGSFASMNAQNITAYLTKVAGKITRDTWHTVTITPNGLTRIIAHAFMIMVVGSATDAIY